MRHIARLLLVFVLLGTAALDQAASAGPKPLVKSSCSTTRNCDYGPPHSVSCTGGVCQSGPDNYGWVQCDGNPRVYCPSPCEANGFCNPAACPTDPDCACPYPSCDSLDGVFCKSSQTTTMCSYGAAPNCQNLTCHCFSNRWICP